MQWGLLGDIKKSRLSPLRKGEPHNSISPPRLNSVQISGPIYLRLQVVQDITNIVEKLVCWVWGLYRERKSDNDRERAAGASPVTLTLLALRSFFLWHPMTSSSYPNQRSWSSIDYRQHGPISHLEPSTRTLSIAKNWAIFWLLELEYVLNHKSQVF